MLEKDSSRRISWDQLLNLKFEDGELAHNLEIPETLKLERSLNFKYRD